MVSLYRKGHFVASNILIGRNTPQDDPDVTPKARSPVPRTISAGAFLKSELYRRSLDVEAGRYSVRGQRNSMYPRDEDIRSRHPVSPAKNWSPAITERRPSKSKNFLLRAIAGRNTEEPKGIKRTDSTLSKNTLIRRLSRSKHKVSGSYDASCEDNISYGRTESSARPESFDIADVGLNSRISFCETPSSYSASDITSTATSQDVFILSPQINITPEVSSVDKGNCDLWVAVEIIGTLHRADGRQNIQRFPFHSSSESSGMYLLLSRDPIRFLCEFLEARHYGRLHSMEIELYPGRDCQILGIIGNLHQILSVHAHETHLVLAKIYLNKVTPLRHVREASSDELIADLETDLGDTISSYLTVRVTYKHSGFPTHKNPALNIEGLSSHTTRLQTEATAIIRRHNSQSAWSPRTSQTMCSPLGSNPLIKLIETHFSSDRAKEALKRLADERAPMPSAKRFQHLPGSSEETVKPHKFGVAARTDSIIAPALISPISAKASPTTLSGPFARLPPAHLPDGRASEEMDPARRIWTEMRRNSRGGRYRHPRTSISANHYFGLEDEISPSRMSSGNSSVSTISSGLGAKRKGGNIDQERSRIMEAALRNKRSVGAETLRSMAPSVVQMGTATVEKAKGGTFGGLSVGLGRTWAWGPPWW